MSAPQVFYRLLLALDMLSQGLAKLTPGRRDEFETAEIKKSFEGNKTKQTSKGCLLILCIVGWDGNGIPWESEVA